MAVANGAAGQPHVPAWKRLGLKLKYAKDTADPPPPQGHSDPAATGKHNDSNPSTTRTSENEPPSKRRKTSPPSDLVCDSNSSSLARASSNKAATHTGAIPDAESLSAKPSVETESVPARHHSDQSKPSEKRPGIAKGRKSVSFTGETKKNDGNSTQAASDPASNGDSVDAEDPNFDASSGASPSEDPKLKEANAPKVGQSAKKEKAQSKPKKKQKNLGGQAQPAGTPEYVRYLEHFHRDQASWKFNKNHQNALLNNLFDIRIVPASLNPAIAAYIEGLRGEGPRQRVTENAIAILRKFAEKDDRLNDIEAMNTESARRKAYIEAAHREIEKWEAAGMPRTEYDEHELAEMEDEMERGKRAEAVLLALAKSEAEVQAASSSVQATSAEGGDVSSTSATVPASTSQPKTTSRKKRKKRTDVSSDSSSSDSSSDSDSDGDGDAPSRAPTEGPSTVKEALRPTPAPLSNSQPKHSPPAKRTPAYQHGDPNIAYRPQNPSQLMNMSAKPTKTKFFDDEPLDRAFPATKTYHESAPKRKREGGKEGKGGGEKARRGYAYQHGNVQDESGSESE